MLIHHLIWIRTGSGDCNDHLGWIRTGSVVKPTLVRNASQSLGPIACGCMRSFVRSLSLPLSLSLVNSFKLISINIIFISLKNSTSAVDKIV